MTEHKTLVTDFEPRVNDTAQGEQNQQSRAEKQLWVRSENSFTFNFFPEGAPAAQGVETALSDVKHQFAGLQTKTSTTSTEQGSGFAFNFQVPVSTPGEMEKEISTPVPSGTVAPKESKEEKPQGQNTQQVIKAPEPTTSSKAKKNKKSGHKKKASEGQQKQMTNLTDTEGACGEDGTILTTEQQLKRELDWCIEQLELGMATLKATPKQKEASRALKTLRSSKAPLAKKRQVMRAMSGDYRKKMEEEKHKQFKLIQAAMTSAQVKVVANSAKKSIFHRKAEGKTETLPLKSNAKSQQENLQAQTPNTSVLNQENSTFVFTPANEAFCFNFL
uniref:Zgc:112185 n=2 Tax=Hucho hucho TaxID=62062 RepID=A0A4W5QH28_9TELE